MATATTPTRIYTPQFFLLCISSFLFFGSFNMIIPELPAYLTSLGGEDYKGLIIALFTVTAGLSRPFSGKLADKIGRIPVMAFGAIVCFICGFLYPVMGTVIGFFFLRFIHGFSTGFQPTGQAAYVADIVPHNQRGEATGILGFFGNIGMAGGQGISSQIVMNFSLDTLFYASSAAALLSILIIAGMKESVVNREKFNLKLLKISRREVIEPSVFAPSFVTLLCVFSFGTVLTVVPDFSIHLGLKDKGVFFTYLTLASLASRLTTGKLSDRFGRVIILKISTFLLMVGLIFLGFVNSTVYLMVASSIIGFAVGMNQPTLLAWTIDLSDRQNLGRGIATMYIALEIGVGSGALIAGWIYANEISRLPYVFWTAALMAGISFIFMILTQRNQKENLE